LVKGNFNKGNFPAQQKERKGIAGVNKKVLKHFVLNRLNAPELPGANANRHIPSPPGETMNLVGRLNGRLLEFISYIICRLERNRFPGMQTFFLSIPPPNLSIKYNFFYWPFLYLPIEIRKNGNDPEKRIIFRHSGKYSIKPDCPFSWQGV